VNACQSLDPDGSGRLGFNDVIREARAWNHICRGAETCCDRRSPAMLRPLSGWNGRDLLWLGSLPGGRLCTATTRKCQEHVWLKLESPHSKGGTVFTTKIMCQMHSASDVLRLRFRGLLAQRAAGKRRAHRLCLRRVPRRCQQTTTPRRRPRTPFEPGRR